MSKALKLLKILEEKKIIIINKFGKFVFIGIDKNYDMHVHSIGNKDHTRTFSLSKQEAEQVQKLIKQGKTEIDLS